MEEEILKLKLQYLQKRYYLINVLWYALMQSLRGALLVIFYGSTVLSGFATIGLVLLARELKSGKK